MTNVVPLNAYAQQSQPAYQPHVSQNTSPIMFTAYERPLWYEGKTGTRYNANTHKALVRMNGDTPSVLNVVNSTYKVIQNAELFRAVEEGLRSTLGREASNAHVIDNVAHGGRLCYRQYVFHELKVGSPEQHDILFRAIVVNGFGGSAIKLYAGAIDMFCTNGMVLGDFTTEYAKHTSGVKIARFTEVVEQAVDVFWKNKARWQMLRDTVIKSDELVLSWLQKEFSERTGLKLFHQYLIEKKVRGGSNMWALYSALTYYSSHSTGDFALRNTKNDHAAQTMLSRENDVRKVVDSAAWDELRVAA